MKILQLRFRNLNSLQGEWFIDFSAPDFAANGIFAITGPTGSGKSTILDAICLALYGETPRLDKIAGSSNEIMSRKTGECFAEVVFESQKGRFKCHWSQRRAKKKADGNLQAPEHEIADDKTGEVLETRRTEVLKAVEEKTGMNFLRFTRSILIAQGGFAAFLQASTNERAPILEQITGTDIYCSISKKVFERQREEKGKLDQLSAAASGIILLSPDDEAQIRHDMASKQQEEGIYSQKLEDSNKALQWLNTIAALRSELTGIKQEAAAIAEKTEAFKLQREKLGMAVQAAELDADYTSLIMTRSQQSADAESLKDNENSLPGLISIQSDHQKLLESAEKQTTDLKNLLKDQQPLLQKVRSLDLHITEKGKAVEAVAAECKKFASQIEENADSQTKTVAAQKLAQSELEKNSAYLIAHAHDETLVSQYAAIAELVGSLQGLAMELQSRREDLEKEQLQVKKAVKELQARDQEFKDCSEEVAAFGKEACKKNEELQKLLGERKLPEYRLEYNHLLKEAGYIRTINDLAGARENLEDGKPCPLCGALEHPFAVGNIPELSENEKKSSAIAVLIEQAEKLESEIKDFQETEKKLEKKLTDSEKKQLQARLAKEVSEKSCVEKQALFDEVNLKNIKSREAVLAKLHGHGIREIPDNDVAALLESLQARLQAWQGKQAARSEIESRLNQLASELKGREDLIASIAANLSGKKTILSDMQQEHARLQAERSELFGNRNPDTEEMQLAKQIETSEKSGKLARESCENAKVRVAEIQNMVRKLQESIAKRAAELVSLERGFALNLDRKGFADEAVFVACRLPVEQRRILAEQAQSLDEKKADAATRLLDRETRLKAEQELNLTTATLEELKPVVAANAARLKVIGEELGGFKQKLADNQKAADLIRGRKVLIDRQAVECQKWDRLNLLIGSKEGLKYQLFAQGLTFGIMVKHANEQLKKMTDRYLLAQDKEQLLELKVLDKYQGGEVRSTKNLSGGESFIVSLALALGMADMASCKVRVDSLFLDEGFGTLDDDALQIALDTLTGLQQDGKLIGVISHVPALKERISTQINVQKGPGGRSTISGPGTARLA